jgi:hypothetical protein
MNMDELVFQRSDLKYSMILKLALYYYNDNILNVA